MPISKFIAPLFPEVAINHPHHAKYQLSQNNSFVLDSSEMRYMNRVKRIIVGSSLLLFLVLSSADAQHLRVNFDYATFRYDSTQTYVELYYGFNRNSVHFKKEDSLYTATVLFALRVEPNGMDTIAYQQFWKVPINVPDTSIGYLNHNLVGQIAMALEPGKYKLFVDVFDENDTTNVDSLRGTLEVPDYFSKKLEASDVELCSMISSEEANPQSVFYKNTLNVVPNPAGIYGAGLPIVYYYVEVYNLLNSGSDSTFKVEYQIRDSFGQVHKSSEKTKTKFGNSSVEVGTVNASNLKTGAYTFIFTVSDSAANLYATSSKRFFVYNPNLGSPVGEGTNLAGASILSSVYAAMGEAQIDKEFAEAHYIATNAEKSQYEKLKGVDAKRQFIYEFWKRRNTDPVSTVNEYRRQYLQRVAYANDHFRAGNREGWQTDRGRVYIMYGQPDEVDRHPNETDSKPYEIWYYNSLQGGVNFDFIDKTGFGDYTLVNSTMRNEIQDPNWQQYLSPGR